MNTLYGNTTSSFLFKTLTLLAIAIFCGGWFSGSTSHSYMIAPLRCPAGSTETRQSHYGTPENLLLNCPHDQGSTPTCSYHAIASLLTVFYNQTKPASSPRANLDTQDLLEKLQADQGLTQTDYDSAVNLIPGLLRVKLRVRQRQLAINSIGSCIKDQTSKTSALWRGVRSLFGYAPACPPTKELVTLPNFNIHTLTIGLPTETVAHHAELFRRIVEYFQSGAPQPLGISYCVETPCKSNFHAVTAIRIGETTCTRTEGGTSTNIYSVYLQNSWGGKKDGPFDLERFVDGIVAEPRRSVVWIDLAP